MEKKKPIEEKKKIEITKVIVQERITEIESSDPGIRKEADEQN